MPKKYFIILALGIVVFGGGFFVARKIYLPSEERVVQPAAQAVLLALKGQGFLITQTYIFNQTVKIDHTSGSFFKDLFWNQVVAASAHVKISSGVDLSKLEPSDISEANGRYTIALPQPGRYSTEIAGEVNVENKQGVLKKVLDSDDGYNQALEALKAEAQKASETPELRQELQRQTEAEIHRIIGLLRPGSEISVVFK